MIDRISYYNDVPTLEDLLDINFQSIVSDCRGILSGNLIPRAWSDIASTWREYELDPYSSVTRAMRPPTPRKKVYKKMSPDEKIVARIFRARGMSTRDARVRVQELK